VAYPARSGQTGQVPEPNGIAAKICLVYLDMSAEPHDAQWQVQEAKQRFSEVLRRARSDGPQVITRHGEEVAVIIDATEFHKLTDEVPDFKEFLRAGPRFDDLDLSRPEDLPREIDWPDPE
jgi:antitoxin Phd